jgi:Large polyvalent protein associated domain 29
MSSTLEVPTRYLSCADTAKLVRKALKSEFPGVKFSVRSSTYAGGASISVGWTDGPVVPDVDAVVEPYRGADFDGMTDMQSYRPHTLMANPDGTYEDISYGADYISCQRRNGPERVAAAEAEVRDFLGRDFEPTERLPMATCRDGILAHDSHGGAWASDIVHQLLYARAA